MSALGGRFPPQSACPEFLNIAQLSACTLTTGSHAMQGVTVLAPLWSPGARSKLAVVGSSLFSQHCKQAFCFGRDCHSAERDTPLSGLPSRSVEVSPHLIWSLLKFLFRSSPSVDQTLSQLLSLGSSSASWLWWNRTRPAGEQPSSLSFLHLCSP